MEGAAGYDLASAEETVVPAKGKAVVKTGMSIATPEGCLWTDCPKVRPGCQKSISMSVLGVIDSDNRGEAGVVLFNHSDEGL